MLQRPRLRAPCLTASAPHARAGVFTLATVALAEVIPSVFLSWLATVFIALLVVLWAFVAARTVQRAWNRSLFVAPCLSTGPTILESELGLAGPEQPVV